MGALFGETGPIDDEHAVALGQHVEEPPPEPVRVSGGVRDEMLKGLIGDRLRDAGQHGLHRLPLAVAEQPVHVRPQRESLRTVTEAPLKRFEPANQTLNMRRRCALDHRAPAYRTHTSGTRPSPRIVKTFRNQRPDLTKSY